METVTKQQQTLPENSYLNEKNLKDSMSIWQKIMPSSQLAQFIVMHITRTVHITTSKNK
jgi:hypothetical protein